MRAVRRRSTTKTPPVPAVRQFSVSHPHHSGNGAAIVSVPYSSTSSRGTHLRQIDESVFAPGPGTDPKLVSLSQLNLNGNEYGRASTYAPSVSTTGAGHGHDGDNTSRRGVSPEPPHIGNGTGGNGIGGTLSSQRRESAFKNGNGSNGLGVPLGYTKPSQGKGAGFLARIGSSRKKQSTEQLTPVSDASTESFNYEVEQRGPSYQHNYSTGAVSLARRFPALLTASDYYTSTRHQPNLAPPIASPSASHGGQLAPPPSGSHDATPEAHSPDTRSRASSEVEDDPYGGYEDDAEELNPTVFRGSRVYPPPRRESLSAGQVMGVDEGQGQPQLGVKVPTTRAGRHDSLPPSPKPDAEVPVSALSLSPPLCSRTSS